MTAEAAAPLLRIEDLSVAYAGRTGTTAAVRNVSLSVAAGEAVGLVGESGCGKSTLAAAVLGYLGGRGRITAGRVVFDGQDLLRLPPGALRRVRGAGIGMVYQEAMAALNPTMRVGDQLAEVLVYHANQRWSAARAAARAALAEVRLPDPDRIMGAYPHQLSGGQQQRVVIAMALLPRPRLLLLDEPTTALDVTVQAGIMSLLADLCRDRGTALLFISHNLGLVAQLCRRVAVMYAGEVVEHGAVGDVLGAPRHPYTQGLVRCIPAPHLPRAAQVLTAIPGQVGAPADGCGFGPRCAHFIPARCGHGRIALEEIGEQAGEQACPQQARCVRWREIPAGRTAAPAIAIRPPSADPILSVRGLDKTYRARGRTGGTVYANRGVDLDAPRGGTLAIVGESGCGKSTLANTLMGLITATGGTARFEALDLAALPVERRPRAVLRSLQMVFQNPDETLNPAYSVGRQLARAVRCLGEGHDGEPRGRRGIAARVAALLEVTRLSPATAGRRPRQLSGGQKQRVGIARALAGRPTMLVADEPVSALDVSVQAAIITLLEEIQADSGTTLVVISHDLGFVRAVADQVVVMYLGRVVEAGPAEQVFAPPYHPYTEALLSAVPSADPGARPRRIVLVGDPPSAVRPPPGCAFHTRCPRRIGPVCDVDSPPEQLAPGGHRIACHIPLRDLAQVPPVFPTAMLSEEVQP